MKGKVTRIVTIVAAVAMVLGLQLSPAAVFFGAGNEAYAAANLVFESKGTRSVNQGSSVTMTFEVLNNSDASYTIERAELIIGKSSGLSTSRTDSATITLGGSGSGNSSAILNFQVKAERRAETGEVDAHILLNGGTDEEVKSQKFSIEILDNSASPGGSGGSSIASVDIIHSITPEAGFEVGSGNTISFEIFNRGTTIIKNANASLVLPDGLSVYNDSDSVNMGYLSIGSTRSIEFPINVDDTVEAKTYTLVLKVSGQNNVGGAIDLEKSFYISVAGGGASVSSSNLVIENISIPGEVTGTDPFTLTFNVRNTSNSDIKNLKVHADVPEGLLNRSSATFVENTFAAGATKSYSINLFADSTSDKTYPIKIAVDPLSGDTGNIVQYTSVYIKGDTSSVKTPQLMVDRYTFGGSNVQAGENFMLNLGLYNTSGKSLSNIKVTLSSDDGVFVPVDSSNSFFVDGIGAKKHYTQAMSFSTKPSAEQKTTSMTVTMKYEDGSGEVFEASDTISIPVTQETRLSVDDIVPPYEVYAGEMGSAELDFYNMGKTTINNLSVNAEGDFDVAQSNRYYVGNMESGRSDSYSFTFIPRQTGPMEGKIIFTYEDSGGQEQYLEVPFNFEVMEMPIWDDPGMMEPEKKPMPWGLIIGGSALVLIVIGLIVWRKIRKRRLHKAMELLDAEDAITDFDIDNAKDEAAEPETGDAGSEKRD